MPVNGWSELHHAAHQGDAPRVRSLLTQGSSSGCIGTGDPPSSSSSSCCCCSDAKGDTPLHAAAHQGHSAVVEMLLNAGASVDARNDAGDTALVAAADGGDEGTAAVLLAAGADSGAVTVTGASALFFAALRGHVRVASLLIRAMPSLVHLADRDGLTPLWAASWKGHAPVVELLLSEAGTGTGSGEGSRKGLDVSLKLAGKLSPLAVASKLGHEATVEALLGALRGPNGEQRKEEEEHQKGDDDHGQKQRRIASEAVEDALLLAAGQGHSRVVKGLLRASKAPPAAAALAASVSGGHEAALRELLEALGPGAARDMATGAGDSLLTLAASHGYLDCAKVLLAAGCSPGPAGALMLFPSGRLPLCQAAAEGHGAVVELLLEHGADPAAVEAGNHTSLYSAASSGHAAAVELLIAAGAPLDEATAAGVTPICAAAREGHAECCRLLLDAGADPFGEGLDSPSALDYCASHANLDALKVLLEAHMLTDVTSGQLLHFGLSRPLVSAAAYGHEEVCHQLLALISEEELSEALSKAAAAPEHEGGGGDHPLHATVAAWVASRRRDLSALQQGIPQALAAAVGGVRRERDAAVRENKRLRTMISERAAAAAAAATAAAAQEAAAT